MRETDFPVARVVCVYVLFFCGRGRNIDERRREGEEKQR